ncbi:MAG: hypothetical protein GWP03_05880 [Proteobacteria bacterium]|nr:hypothetical protein [Pseudomonadota bacterium]
MREIVYPDYENSILNFISSLLVAFGVDSSHKPLSFVDSRKVAEKKDIVLIILDGMGYNLYEQVERETDLKKSTVRKITSVFPPTTASAITSIMTGKSPLEHGIIGWTLFFKEFGKFIDVLPKIESPTGELLNDSYNVTGIMSIENIFQSISKRSPDMDLIKITPSYIAKSDFSLSISSPAKIVPYEKISEMLSNIESAVKENDRKKFIVAYSTNPDGLEHMNGVGSEKVLLFMKDAFGKINTLADSLKDRDVTIFITADHGLTDVDRYIYVDDDKELFDTLVLPLFPEPRFSTFFIKSGKEERFKRAIGKYESEFLIMSRDEFFERGFLGEGKPHKKIDDFIGDYVAIAKSTTVFKMRYGQNIRKLIEFKAHHAGLTSDEMYVPLIEINPD